MFQSVHPEQLRAFAMSVHELFTVEPLEELDWVDPSRLARGVRLRSDAGPLAIIENGDATIGYVAAFRVHAGGSRGGHYHRQKVETLTVLEGEVWVTLAHSNAPGPATTVRLNSSQRLTIKPGCAHILRAESDVWVIETAPQPVQLSDSVAYSFD